MISIMRVTIIVYQGKFTPKMVFSIGCSNAQSTESTAKCVIAGIH